MGYKTLPARICLGVLARFAVRLHFKPLWWLMDWKAELL
jgi:hypothetical protein